MAESTSVALQPSVPDEDLRRAEEFTLEPFVHQGEERDEVLAPGTARRRALDDALAEIDAGREEPSVEWRREYALMLGLERLLSDDERSIEATAYDMGFSSPSAFHKAFKRWTGTTPKEFRQRRGS